MKKQALVAIVLLTILFLQGCGSFVHHTVRKGETLYSISWSYGEDYKNIARWNNIKPPYVISDGQVLRISPPSEKVQRSSQLADVKKQDIELAPDSVKKAKLKPSVSNKDLANKLTAGSAVEILKPAKRAVTALKNHKIDKWYWPVKGKLLKAYSKKAAGHNGIDIAGQSGAKIRAAAPGNVVYAGSGIPSYGNLLIIKHNNKYLSAYAHNRTLLVNEGDNVKVGQIIAEMGQTGTDRDKLHFEIRLNGRPVNPLQYLNKKY